MAIVDIEKKASGQWWGVDENGKKRRLSEEAAREFFRTQRPQRMSPHSTPKTEGESLLQRRRQRRQQRAASESGPSLLQRRRARRSKHRQVEDTRQTQNVVVDDDNTGE